MMGVRPLLLACVFAIPSLAMAAIKEEPIPELKAPAGRLELREEKKPSRGWMVWPAIGAVVGVVILLASQRKAAPPVPPAEGARRELQALNGKGDAAGVARVFRGYVEAAMGVRGRSATVDEMIAALSGRAGWSDALGWRVRRFLDPVELSNFAPEVPAPAVEGAVKEALELVSELEKMRGGQA